jgi:hypothetical protein
MNNGAKIAMGIAIGALAGTGLYLYNQSGKLQFGSVKKTGQRFKTSHVEIYLNMPVTNPTNTQLPFDNFTGKWSYNGHDLADVVVEKWENNQRVSINIEAKKTVNFPITIKINYFKAAGEIQDMVSSQSFLGASLLKGVVTSGGLKFPIETKIF